MIKVSELRIGNWIQAVAPMGNYNMRMQSVNFESLEKNPDCANPIPLSSGLLQLCGFVVQELPVNYAGGMNGYKIQIQSSANRWLMLTGRGLMIGHINENDNIYNGASIGTYRYVHEVQNLYFALTGKELEVKLGV